MNARRHGSMVPGASVMKLHRVTAARPRARSLWDTHQFPINEVCYAAVLREGRDELGALLILLRADGSLVDEVWYPSEEEAVRSTAEAFVLAPGQWAVLPDAAQVPRDLPPDLRSPW